MTVAQREKVVNLCPCEEIQPFTNEANRSLDGLTVAASHGVKRRGAQRRRH
jgi:hypothetical protein